MKVNVETSRPKDIVMKGDILVFQSRSGKTMYYLVIEDVPRRTYLLLNLEGNNLMSSVETSNIDYLLTKAKSRFYKLNFIKVIPAETFELKSI